MKNAEHFLETMRGLHPEIDDYTDAVEFAMTQVPMVGHDLWFGEIGKAGVYFANDSESRWFPNSSKEEVAKILTEELL